MMSSRERVRKALTFQGPDRAPRDLWALGTILRRYKAELETVLARFPGDITSAPVKWGQSQRGMILTASSDGDDAPLVQVGAGTELRHQIAAACMVGRYIDEWGSEWEVLEPGLVGEVREPALSDWSRLDSYVPPYEILDGLDVWPSVAFYEQTDRFVVAYSTVQPFQRLIFLRGFENLMLDLGYNSTELLRLLETIHEYYVRELELLAHVSADAVQFKDDWGSETSLLISPQQWRRLFKPLYAEYCRIIHDAGKFVFFHSDGHISSIYADLIEVGVDAINSQLFCMDIEGLATQHKGSITFWGEIDRRLLAFGSPADVRAAVQRVRRALDDGQGGVIAQLEWGNDTPRANVEAAFEAWLIRLE
jgi:uroporphyrinogen decarboxylase